jgi:phosphatidylserine/phosphatidylglycerophosphate/cardiolipin synthase-like enzyme
LIHKQVHGKVIVVDRKKAVIGSANFTWSGMYGNYEIGVMVYDRQDWKLAKVIDILSFMGKSMNK